VIIVAAAGGTGGACRDALRAQGHPRRGPAAHRPRHRLRGAAVSHRRHLQRRQGRHAALRSLFATGLFKDVRIEIEDQVAVVIVDERARHRQRQLRRPEGVRQGPADQVAADAGIGEGLPFDRALIDRAEQEIKRQYLSRSLYGAEVVTTITPIERNRVNVTFTMTEGDAARIKDIRIVGAKAFSNRRCWACST
jgi:outer membrane protein assembly factor BamA